MLQNIPTHVIAGPLGAGKTSLIRQLLAQRPAGERWAVLINEFGQIGLDAALLTRAGDGIALGEVAGGCLCCVNGAPFQVGLARLLRKARPDRLFIEPSGLGHPAQILAQLQVAPWAGVLAVQPCVLVLDAAALAAGKPLPAAQQEALPAAGLLVLNKSEGLSQAERQRLVTLLPAGSALYWSVQAALPLALLPGATTHAGAPVDNPALPAGPSPMPMLWSDPRQPICLSQQQAQGWSIGWRWHPSQQFDRERLEHFLGKLDWQRAKAVIHSPAGWISTNAVDNSALEWLPSEWSRDSRLELIFAAEQDEQALRAGLAACLCEKQG